MGGGPRAGQLLLVASFERRATAWSVGTRYSHADRDYEIVGEEQAEIGTRFGKVAITAGLHPRDIQERLSHATLA